MIKLITLLYRRVVNFIREKIAQRGVEYVKLELLNNSYSYVKSNSEELCTLICFLRYDCESFRFASLRESILDETWLGGCGELTSIDKEDGYIYLSDLDPDEDEEDNDYYIELKMTVDQLITVMDEWQVIINLEKKPKEIIIKYKDDQFTFETYD